MSAAEYARDMIKKYQMYIENLTWAKENNRLNPDEVQIINYRIRAYQEAINDFKIIS